MQMHESIKVGVLITKQLTMGVIISFLFFSFLFFSFLFLARTIKGKSWVITMVIKYVGLFGARNFEILGLDF